MATIFQRFILQPTKVYSCKLTPRQYFTKGRSQLSDGICYTVTPCHQSASVNALKILGQTSRSLRRATAEKINSIRSLPLKPGRLRIDSKWCKKLMKPIYMSAFLTPTLMYGNQQEEVQPKVMPVVIKKQEKPRPGVVVGLLVWLYEGVRLCVRALRLALTFTPILALYPITFLGERMTELWWGLLLKGIEASGPIVIKLGQWASTRRDIFPDTCCRQFAKLQRHVTPHSWAFTKYQLRKAFGKDWRKIFVKFDNNCNPVGSGCVAQVYKAWMSVDSIPDEEIVSEMLSDMDDDPVDHFEGFHVLGLGEVLGWGAREEAEQREAIKDWRVRRAAARLSENSGVVEGGTDVPPQAGYAPADTHLAQPAQSGESQNDAPAEDQDTAMEHPLVEAWQEEGLDKSLPVEDEDWGDVEGLVPVAVKVLHPGLHSAFRRDLRILRWWAWAVSGVVPGLHWLALPQCVDEFAQVMWAQINLKIEAKNLEAFSENFSEVPIVKFPRPLRPYVTSKVLVETFEEGQHMIHYIGAAGEDKPQDVKLRLAQIGVDALLKMVFVDNLVHGDLHPGNILVQNDSTGTTTTVAGDVVKMVMVDVGCDTFVVDVAPDPNPLRICLLDCGVVSRLAHQDLTNFKAVFKQVVFGDGGSVAQLFLDNSEHECQDPEAFKTEMSSLVESARENAVSLAQVDVGVLLQQVLGVLLRHRVRLESAFSAVVLAIFVLEGLGRALDPDMDILERARPVLLSGKV